LAVIDYSEQFEDKKKYIISRQLLKSGTSIGANVREAQNAESKADFVHKLKIAAKEADERAMRKIFTTTEKDIMAYSM
jgi:four helix bundle protein